MKLEGCIFSRKKTFMKCQRIYILNNSIFFFIVKLIFSITFLNNFSFSYFKMIKVLHFYF